MAEALARRALAARGIDATVHSCGMLDDGMAVPEEVLALMGPRGLDLSGHRSRRMTREIISGATLVLGMERQHVREVVNLAPEAFRRTFTLPELARRLDALELPDAGVGPVSDGTAPDLTAPDLEVLLDRLAAGRSRRDLLGSSAADEIDDPIGRPMRVFTRVADEIDDAFSRVVAHLWPVPDAEADAPGNDPNPDAAHATEPASAVVGRPARVNPIGPKDSAAVAERSVASREAARARRTAALRGPVGRLRRGRGR